ncbi:MAG: hypothetical protein JJT96_11670 [Opitutales bacterium]|nr:hypothetical protein [Opitutales bacterium]
MVEAPHISFAPLIEEALAELPPGETLERVLPPDYAAPENARMSLRARFADWLGRGSFRSVYITNGKVEVANMFFFPFGECNVSLYAMEFVRFGPKGVVGVIDLASDGASLSADRLGRELLQQTHAAFPRLINGDDPPPWYEECRSGDDFFIRPRDSADMEALCAAQSFIWKAYRKMVAGAPEINVSALADHERALAAYMDHHRIHSPGLPLLHRTFGETWTDTFLREFLFKPHSPSAAPDYG